jgi:hypothetical protein
LIDKNSLQSGSIVQKRQFCVKGILVTSYRKEALREEALIFMLEIMMPRKILI